MCSSTPMDDTMQGCDTNCGTERPKLSLEFLQEVPLLCDVLEMKEKSYMWVVVRLRRTCTRLLASAIPKLCQVCEGSVVHDFCWSLNRRHGKQSGLWRDVRIAMQVERSL